MKYICITFCVLVGVSISSLSFASPYVTHELEETVRILQGFLLDKNEYLFEKNKQCAKLLDEMYEDLHGENSDFAGFKPKILTTYFTEEKYSCFYEFEITQEEGTTAYVVNYFSKHIAEK